MSHTIKVIKSKQKHPKVFLEQYLLSDDEPQDNIYQENPPVVVDRLQQQADRYYMIMRRKIKLNAQRLRTRYSIEEG